MKKAIYLFIANVIVIGIVVAILKDVLKLETYEEILLAITLFIAFTLLELQVNGNKALEQTQDVCSQKPVWVETRDAVRRLKVFQDHVENYSTNLQDISEGLKTIAGKKTTENGLFEHLYEEKLRSLGKHVKHTVQTNCYHFETTLLQEEDKIYDVFQGRPTDYFWATSTCDGISWFRSTSGEMFLTAIDAKVKGKKVCALRRLFSYKSPDELKKKDVELFLALHAASGYEYKVIKKNDFDNIIKGFHDDSLVPDFGVYGTHFVWETHPDFNIYIESGDFCADKLKVKQYYALFNKLWGQAKNHPVQITDTYREKGYRVDNFRRLFDENP